MSILLVIFTFQFIPKVYHSMSLIRRMAKVTGYIFGTISLGFTLNIIAYLIASHVVGGCWYALAIQRVVLCLRKQCNEKNACNLALSCANDICYEFLSHEGTFGDRCAGNSTTNFDRTLCLDMDGSYNFGIYGMALPVVSSNARTFKILYTIAWGLFSLAEANHCIKYDCFCKPEVTKLPPPCSREDVECNDCNMDQWIFHKGI
ncbi:hypothetical protein HanPI659440_Chr09g0325821 [Helianthus annuus]|nr:hypothetical protein HanPI659440_Chr09g0325821 [Helianthus annuus]